MKPKGTSQKHSRTRQKARLIEAKYRGERNRCSICDNPVRTLRYATREDGARREVQVAKYCSECEIIFPYKRVVISKYENVIIEKR